MTAEKQGATVWLTGLPSAGKTTIALALADRLRAMGHQVEILDGDETRRSLSPDLGFTRADRDTHVGRIGYVAHLLARNQVKVLVPVIAPYAAARAAVRAGHEADGIPYVEVHVATPIEVCESRDVKGLYAKHRDGLVRNLTGVDDPYEVPMAPEIRLQTQGRTVLECVLEIQAVLEHKSLVSRSEVIPAATSTDTRQW